MADVMTREEFIAKVTIGDYEEATVESWVSSTSATIAYMSIEHEALEKEDIVAALQSLAVAMPTVLVQAATGAFVEVADKF